MNYNPNDISIPQRNTQNSSFVETVLTAQTNSIVIFDSNKNITTIPISTSFVPSVSSSYANTASYSISSSWAPVNVQISSSWASASLSSSWAPVNVQISSSWASASLSSSWSPVPISASWSSASLFSTSASFASRSISSSNALTASYIAASGVVGTVVSSSYATTASYSPIQLPSISEAGGSVTRVNIVTNDNGVNITTEPSSPITLAAGSDISLGGSIIITAGNAPRTIGDTGVGGQINITAGEGEEGNVITIRGGAGGSRGGDVLINGGAVDTGVDTGNIIIDGAEVDITSTSSDVAIQGYYDVRLTANSNINLNANGSVIIGAGGTLITTIAGVGTLAPENLTRTSQIDQQGTLRCWDGLRMPYSSSADTLPYLSVNTGSMYMRISGSTTLLFVYNGSRWTSASLA